MCNLYRMTSNVDAMRQLFGPVETGGANVPPLHEIWPDRAAPVIVATEDGTRRLESMAWGWPPFGDLKRSITNVRNLASPMWRGALADPMRRCLVPVTAYCEWSARPDPATGRKVRHWFALPGEDLFAFAGLWRPTDSGPRFAFLTCPANETVARIHPKAMPVMLAGRDMAQRWMTADGTGAAAMQHPFPDAEMMELPPEPSPGEQGALL
ncbi:SOS response-associated peptidase family protein [Novosphingobium sp. ZN18A2]|uniref:SOS response-associated peptidase n=1 Tax=Novosphingobium sp. ZN18A2 TaxID=3079861 RepID=UPI0030D1C7BA